MNKKEKVKLQELILLQMEYLSKHKPDLNSDFKKIIIEYLSYMSLDNLVLITNCIDTFNRGSQEFRYFTINHIDLLLNKKYQEKFYDRLTSYNVNNISGYKMSMFKSLKFMSDHDWKHIEKGSRFDVYNHPTYHDMLKEVS